MRKRLFVWTLIVLLAPLGIGCGGDSSPEEAEEQARKTEADSVAVEEPENLEAALKQAEKALGSSKNVEPVDFRRLKALLPDDVSGMERSGASGQKTGAFGVKMSTAEGKYKPKSGPGHVTVSITDLGTMKGASMMGYAWMMADFDRESDTGYERTTKFKGHPAYEKFDHDKTHRRGEMDVVVAQRFVVTVKGEGVEMEVIKEAMEKIDLDELEDMKSVGVK